MAKSPAYGQINVETAGRWLQLPAEEDGHVWMLNLMKYHRVAQYADGNAEQISGEAADDKYAPLGPLAAVGATAAFLASVAEQPAGTPAWDRIGIVDYPTRAAFFAMQQRDDFKAQHEHKEAGMEFTIVMGTEPVATGPGVAADGALVLRVRRVAEGGAATDPDGVTPVAHFGVDGVILGDERTWNDVRFDRVRAEAMSALVDVAGVEEQIVVVLAEPRVDRLVETIEAAR
ncbi:MAG: hypothetical protein ACKOZL_04130 [Actinomycetes bacterium]